MRMFSHSSTSARQPGGTTVVESNWSTIAGPVEARSPAGRSSRDVDRRVDAARRHSKNVTGRRERGLGVAPVRRVARELGFGVTPIAVTLQAVDLDRRVVAAEVVLALVLGVERAPQPARDRAARSTGTASERHWPR